MSNASNYFRHQALEQQAKEAADKPKKLLSVIGALYPKRVKARSKRGWTAQGEKK